MSDVRITYTLPSVSGTQRPLSHVLIQTRVDPSLPWSGGVQVDVPAEEWTFIDVDSGTWYYLLTVFDDADVPSLNPVEVSIDVPFDAPGDVTNVNVSIV